MAADDVTWDSFCWYAVHTHPKQEDRAERNLNAWKLETFTPKFVDHRFNPYTGKRTPVVKYLFPRYVFVRFKINDSYHKVRFTRGVHSLVGFNDYPYTVDDSIINIMKSRVGKDGYIKIGEEFAPGDTVIIKQGPLKNFVGIFERESKETDRITILLETISYQAHVVVERAMIEKFNC
jgi:transcriptional antiterminator RfaH